MAEYHDAMTLAELLENAGSRAILERYLPGIEYNPMARSMRRMSVAQIRKMAPSAALREKLAEIEKELAAHFAKDI